MTMQDLLASRIHAMLGPRFLAALRAFVEVERRRAFEQREKRAARRDRAQRLG
jgi:hypothetical protein